MVNEHQNLKMEPLNYGSYLKVPDLLELQHLLSDPPHHDEMFFIIIHQAAELWFKLMLHETETLVAALREDSVSRSLKKLKRITGVMDLLIKQINLLSTLTPEEFAGFRDQLRPASGFQSFQFRKMEFAYGLRDPFFKKYFQPFPHHADELEAISKKPTVYDECLKALARHFEIPKDTYERDFTKDRVISDALVMSMKRIYENPKDNYHWVLMFENMLDLDEKLAHWRYVHILMVARTIGGKHGTGGSSGQPFLKSRLDLRLFPELWEVRNQIGGTY